MAASPKLKIVCLHGFNMSAELFSAKIGSVRSDLKKKCDFFFPQGPIVVPPGTALPPGAQPAPLDPSAPPPPPMYSWYDFSEELPDGNRKYAKVDECIGYLQQYCDANGPFDGILAFSQGVVVASMWVARMPELPPSMRVKWCALYSGLLPKDPAVREEITARVPVAVQALGIASLHCCGANDALIEPRLTRELAAVFEKGLLKEGEGSDAVGVAASRHTAPFALIEHEGGHVVPTSARKDLKAFLASL
jgi:predicted esterase